MSDIQQKDIENDALTKAQLIEEGLDPDMDGLEGLSDDDVVIGLGFMEEHNSVLDGDIVEKEDELKLDLDAETKKKLSLAQLEEPVSNEPKYITQYLDNLEYRYRISELLTREGEIPFGTDL